MGRLDLCLVGRDEELESALGLYSRAVAGNGSLLIVLGDAGIGKTRYVEELMRMVEKTRCEVLTGRCSIGDTVPYLPFIEAFSSQPDRNPFGPGSETGRPVTSSSPQDALFPTLHFLSRLASKRPVIIHIEDIQWADSSTIELLHSLARSIGSLRVLIIATYRTGMPGQGPDSKADIVLNTIQAMRCEGLLHEIALKPLRPKDLQQIARSMTGGELTARTLQRLISFTNGNPLFFIETLRFLSLNDSMHEADGYWELEEGIGIELPPSIQELVLGRLDHLTPTQRKILEYAAVAGEWFDMDLLTGAFHLPRKEVSEALNSLSNAHHLIEVTKQRYRFEHQVIQRAVYQHMSPELRKELHQMLGETIESSQKEDLPFSSLSDHFYQAGNLEKGLKYSLFAGENFLKASAYPEALSFLSRAESMINKTSGMELKLRVLEGLGDVQAEMAQEGTADGYYLASLQLVSSSSRDQGRLLRKRANCWYPLALGKGDSTECLKLLEQAECCPGLDPLDLAEVEYMRGFIDFLGYSYEEAKPHYSTATRIFFEHKAWNRLIPAMIEEVEILLSEGKVVKSLDKLQDIGRYSNAEGRKTLEVPTRFASAVTFWHMGRLKDALVEYGGCLEIATKIGNFQMSALAYQYSGLVYIEINDLASAEACMKDCQEQLELMKILTLHSRTLAYLAHIQLRRGRVNEAKPLLAEASGEIEDFSSPLNITSGIVKLVEAEMFVALGHKDLGRSEFSTAIGLLSKSVYGIMFEALGMTWYAESLRRAGYGGEADELIHCAMRNYDRLGNKQAMERVMKSS